MSDFACSPVDGFPMPAAKKNHAADLLYRRAPGAIYRFVALP